MVNKLMRDRAQDKTTRAVVGAVAVLGLCGLVWGVTAASAGWRQPQRPGNDTPEAAWMTLPPTAAGPGLGPSTPASGPTAVRTVALALDAPAPAASAIPPQGTAPAASAEERAAFQRECVEPLREQRYKQAVRQCAHHAGQPALAGAAHAALAAAYSAPGHTDLRASARHAERAAAAGDARGKFMAALHLLAGRSEQPFDLGLAEAWLGQAASQRVPHAARLQARVAEARTCRRAESFKLLDAPVFCLFRPEMEQVLRDHGMSSLDPIEADLEQTWTARWQPGGALAGASLAQADYDRDPADELLRLARFTYRFEPPAARERAAGLAQALLRKYGPPQAGRADPAPGAQALWRLPGGIELRLLREADGALAIEYRHAARWQARAQHWAQAVRAQQLARLRRDEAAL